MFKEAKNFQLYVCGSVHHCLGLMLMFYCQQREQGR